MAPNVDVALASAHVRAKALLGDGSLADEFLIVEGRRSFHVLNAPSPGAKSSLVIGESLARRIPEAAGRPIERPGLASVT